MWLRWCEREGGGVSFQIPLKFVRFRNYLPRVLGRAEPKQQFCCQKSEDRSHTVAARFIAALPKQSNFHQRGAQNSIQIGIRTRHGLLAVETAPRKRRAVPSEVPKQLAQGTAVVSDNRKDECLEACAQVGEAQDDGLLCRDVRNCGERG